MPNYYPQYYYPAPVQQQIVTPQAQPQSQLQIQSSGFVSVRNEDEARNYPVAPGNSVTFKDETAPYVYTKTMGFSQLDRPIFEKFKLVKEDTSETHQDVQNELLRDDPINSTIDDLKDQIDAIWSEIEDIKNVRQKTQKQTTQKRDRDGGDD